MASLASRIMRLEGFSGDSEPGVSMTGGFPDTDTLEEWLAAKAIIDEEYLRWKTFRAEGRSYSNSESLERIKDQILKQRSEARL